MSRRRRWMLRFLFLLVGTYFALFLVDLGHQVAWKREHQLLQRRPTTTGLFVLDSELGFALRPGFAGDYPADLEGFEGRRRRILVNEHGHREAALAGPVDTLIVGDSFVFGALLDQDDTIAAQATRLARRRFYGVGVSGYDARQVLGALRRALPLTKPSRVVYVFYENDLMHRERTYRITPQDTFQALNYGTWLPDANAPMAPVDVLESLKLRGLQGRRLPDLFAPRATPADALATADLTSEMASCARQHGAGFSTFVVPTIVETVLGRRFDVIEAYAALVRSRGIDVQTCALDRSDFFPVDQHCNARGAAKIARALIAQQDAP
jgi:hypothetical protein